MQGKSIYSKQGLVYRVDMKLTKRDLVKVFAVVVLAEMFAHYPVSRKRVDQAAKWVEATGERIVKSTSQNDH